MQSHTVSRADGPALHAVETGPRDGPPVLFVHGYSQHHLTWLEQFDGGLATDHRLVAMDLRGHGDSETPPGGYDDSAAWAGDVAAVVDALDLDGVTLVGWSYGSLVVLDYLAEFGTDRVAAAALVGVVLGIGTERTNGWLGEGYVDLFPEITSTDAETSVEALGRLVDLCVRGDLARTDRFRMLGYSAVVPPRVRDAMRDRTVSHVDRLGDVDVPVLLAHGAHDAVVAPAAAAFAADRLPDATLSTYDDCGHSPFYEAPDRFDAELRALVDGARSTGGGD